MAMSSSLSCILLTLCFTFVTIYGATYMETKADFLKTCTSTDSNFSACTTESIAQLYKQLGTGIDGLDSVEFDPFKLEELVIVGDDGGGPVSLNVTLNEVVLTGFSTITVDKADFVPSNQTWILKLSLPKVNIKGFYRMKGKILVLPLVGSGKCWIEPSGLNITGYLKTDLYENDGHIFFNVTEVKVEYQFADVKLHFDNLFKGIKALEETTNQYFNENWRELLDALPIVKKIIEEVYGTLYNKIFGYIPAEYFLSDVQISPVW